MIDNEHPGFALLRDAPFTFFLVGSRMVGPHDPQTADYDFLMVANGDGLGWLRSHSFEMVPESYEKDPRLQSSYVWRRTWDGWPPIDVLPMCDDEAEFRMNFFRAMRAIGDRRGGLLSKALKEAKAWPHLWAALATFAKGPPNDR